MNIDLETWVAGWRVLLACLADLKRLETEAAQQRLRGEAEDSQAGAAADAE